MGVSTISWSQALHKERLGTRLTLPLARARGVMITLPLARARGVITS